MHKDWVLLCILVQVIFITQFTRKIILFVLGKVKMLVNKTTSKVFFFFDYTETFIEIYFFLFFLDTLIPWTFFLRVVPKQNIIDVVFFLETRNCCWLKTNQLNLCRPTCNTLNLPGLCSIGESFKGSSSVN